MLQGRVRGCLPEPTADDAVSADGSLRIDTARALLVMTNVHGIEDAFDCVIWPN